MSGEALTASADILTGNRGAIQDAVADKQMFQVPWGKAMMWIFLLSDTFIFSCFLISYMTVRMSTTLGSLRSPITASAKIGSSLLARSNSFSSR